MTIVIVAIVQLGIGFLLGIIFMSQRVPRGPKAPRQPTFDDIMNEKAYAASAARLEEIRARARPLAKDVIDPAAQFKKLTRG